MLVLRELITVNETKYFRIEESLIKHIQTPLCFHLSREIVFFKVNERGKGKRYRDTKRQEKRIENSKKREEREGGRKRRQKREERGK